MADLYPEYFGSSTRADFEWAVVFVTTRCFGWGLPSTMLVPFADAINHANESIINYNLFHKNLHLSSNKIYLHETDFETFEYDTNSSKQDINISRIFKDDQ